MSERATEAAQAAQAAGAAGAAEAAEAAEALVVLVTAPDDEVAMTLARAVVDERLAACVSVLGGVRSVYRWEGEICDEAEVQLLIKTRRGRVEALIARVAELHPYDVPEVIAAPVVAGLAPYLAWIGAETSAQTGAQEG